MTNAKYFCTSMFGHIHLFVFVAESDYYGSTHHAFDSKEDREGKNEKKYSNPLHATTMSHIIDENYAHNCDHM